MKTSLHGRWKPYVLFMLMALLAVLLVLFSTTWGVGLPPDSVTYIDVARSLLAGRGLYHTNNGTDWVPLTQYPPLFPAVLALVGALGVPLVDAARYVNALLFGGTVLLAGLSVLQYSRGAVWLAVLGAYFILSSIDLIHVHSSALSEPLFIFLGLASLVCMSGYLERGRGWMLVASAVAGSLSFAARYPGVSFVIAAAGGLIFFHRESPSRRLRDLAVLLAVGCGPMSVWMVRNLSLTGVAAGSAAGVEIAARPWVSGVLKSGLQTVTAWVLPTVVPFPVRLVVFVVGVVLLALTVLLLLRKRASGGLRTGGATSPVLSSLPYLLLIFDAVYLGLVMVSVATAGQGTLDRRFLAVVFVTVVVVMACFAHRFASGVLGAPLARCVFSAVLVLLGAVYLASASTWVLRSHLNGLGYSGRMWKRSEIMAQVALLPPNVDIYSNGADAIYLLTGRPAHWIPVGGASGVDARREQIADMKQRLAEGKAVVVFLYLITWRSHFPSAEDLAALLPLRLLVDGADGAIYTGRLEVTPYDRH